MSVWSNLKETTRSKDGPEVVLPLWSGRAQRIGAFFVSVMKASSAEEGGVPSAVTLLGLKGSARVTELSDLVSVALALCGM